MDTHVQKRQKEVYFYLSFHVLYFFLFSKKNYYLYLHLSLLDEYYSVIFHCFQFIILITFFVVAAHHTSMLTCYNNGNAIVTLCKVAKFTAASINDAPIMVIVIIFAL